MGVVLVWTLLAAGCLHLNEYDRLKFSLGALPGPPPEAAARVDSMGWARWTAGLGLVLLGVAWVGRRWWRLRREGGRAQPLDREDLALVRTARDALLYLLGKRFTRLGVVWLADFQRRRGTRGP